MTVSLRGNERSNDISVVILVRGGAHIRERRGDISEWVHLMVVSLYGSTRNKFSKKG